VPNDSNVPHTKRLINLTGPQKTNIVNAGSAAVARITSKVSDVPFNDTFWKLQQAIRDTEEAAYKANGDST
jgi:hypothetical protein